MFPLTPREPPPHTSLTCWDPDFERPLLMGLVQSVEGGIAFLVVVYGVSAQVKCYRGQEQRWNQGQVSDVLGLQLRARQLPREWVTGPPLQPLSWKGLLSPF